MSSSTFSGPRHLACVSWDRLWDALRLTPQGEEAAPSTRGARARCRPQNLSDATKEPHVVTPSQLCSLPRMDPSARLEKATPSRELHPVKAEQILVREDLPPALERGTYEEHL